MASNDNTTWNMEQLFTGGRARALINTLAYFETGEAIEGEQVGPL